MKTIFEKIQEKKETLSEINSTIVISMDLYQTLTSYYGDLYGANQAKVDSKHILGISTLLSKITEAIKAKSEIQNEINALEELEEASTNPTGQKNEEKNNSPGGVLHYTSMWAIIFTK